MKKQERYKLLNSAREDYSERFDCDYVFKKLSKRDLYKLLQQNKHSSMCEWFYCCQGLYENCWQELIQVGIWGVTQEDVDYDIKYAIDVTAKACRKDNRILYREDEYGIHVVIIARDVTFNQCDYLITFRNKPED